MTDPMPVSDPVVVAPKAASQWEDLLDIFYAPREVFARRRDGKYLILILAIAVVSAIVMFLSGQFMEAVQDIEMARVGKEQGFTPEQMKAAKEGAAKFAGLAIYFVPVFVAIGAWVGGFVLWLLGRFMGASLNFAQGTTIALLASMPEVLERVLVAAQGLVLDSATVAHRYSFNIGLARFLPAGTGNWTLKLASLADPFVIWGIILTGIGVFVMGRMEKEKAAVLAIVSALITTALFR